MIRTIEDYCRHLIENDMYDGVGFKLMLAEILVKQNIIRTPKEYLKFMDNYKELDRKI